MSGASKGAKNLNSFEEENTDNAAGKGRLPQPLRGIANFLNEEGAAAREDHSTLRKLKKNPKY